MNVLVIGSGGREHALAWAVAKSPNLTRLWAAPGNAGINQVAEPVALGVEDIDGIMDFVAANAIDLVIIGPEAPLVLGLADRLEQAGVKAFGPSAAAAALEGSKGFTKDLCAKYNIPTADYGRFADKDAALAFLEKQGAPIVVKADGLAAGKGVIIAMTMDEAVAAVEEIFGGKFGDAGAEVVIEEFMVGEEASFFAITDGTSVLPLATAQDHKRVGDGDTGPNTGGMGAYSPAPVMTEALCDMVMDTIIKPTVEAMKAEGRPYLGVLYAGLMMVDGTPKLIEYNARFGDPECQVLMMRLQSDALEMLDACAARKLAEVTPVWHDDVALTVVMAAKGYPEGYEKGTVIKGVDMAEADDAVKVFHAGTKMDGDALLANGGRVLNVTARGATVSEAQVKAYTAVDKIDWPEGFCRRDIGWRAVAREQA